jgi:hypothetical protein
MAGDFSKVFPVRHTVPSQKFVDEHPAAAHRVRKFAAFAFGRARGRRCPEANWRICTANF